MKLIWEDDNEEDEEEMIDDWGGGLCLMKSGLYTCPMGKTFLYGPWVETCYTLMVIRRFFMMMIEVAPSYLFSAH